MSGSAKPHAVTMGMPERVRRDPQDSTIRGWVKRSTVFNRNMNTVLYDILHDSLRRNGLQGDQTGLMEALCHGHPNRGNPIPRNFYITNPKEATYRGVSDAIDAWAEGIDPKRIPLIVAYDESSYLRRLGRADWTNARDGLFMDSLRDGDPSLVPSIDDSGLTEWDRNGSQGYRLEWSGDEGPDTRTRIGLGDLYYWMSLFFPKDAMGALRTMGWRRAANLFIVTRYNFYDYGYRASNARRLAVECLDRYGLETFDKCLRVFSSMLDGKWKAPVPSTEYLHDNNDLPVSFIVEDAEAMMSPEMEKAGDNEAYYRKVSEFGSWWKSVRSLESDLKQWWRTIDGADYDSKSGMRIKRVLSILSGKIHGSRLLTIEERTECVGIMKTMRTITGDEYRLCGDLFAHAVDSPDELKEALEDGADSLLRCSMIVAAMFTTRREASSSFYIHNLEPWMRDYIKDGSIPDRVGRGAGMRKTLSGLPSTVVGMSKLVGPGRDAQDLQTLFGTPAAFRY